MRNANRPQPSRRKVDGIKTKPGAKMFQIPHRMIVTNKYVREPDFYRDQFSR